MATTADASFLARHVPALAWLRGYRWGSWLRADVVAGVSLAALLIPESMGYAGIAGLPPQVGLYAAPLALLGYAVFGRSTVLVVAASTSTAAISASVIAGVDSGGGEEAALALSAALALFTGAILIAAGIARLGWVVNFMSKTVIEGFIVGLSISIIIGQLDGLLGITVAGENAIEKLIDVLRQAGGWNQATAVAGAASLALLFGLERFVRRLPAALAVVALSVAAVAVFDPSGIEIVGDIPQGLPSVGIPEFSGADVVGLLTGALAVALVGFSEGYGVASSYARKYGDRLDSNQEFIAVGVSNVGAAFTSGMVVGGGLSKTAAADAAKARSQLANIVAAALVVLTLLFLAPFFEKLPETTLAAIVIHALWRSADPRKLARVRRVTPGEFWLALAVLVAVLVLDTLPAIALGVAISLVLLVYHVSFPRASELRRDQETGLFESHDFHDDAEPVPGVVVYRFEAPLIYANAEAFAAQARRLVDAAGPEAHSLVVDCEEMFEVDFTGADAIAGLVADMRAREVEVRLARVHAPVLERLTRSGAIAAVGERLVFARVEDAVDAGRTQGTPPPG